MILPYRCENCTPEVPRNSDGAFQCFFTGTTYLLMCCRKIHPNMDGDSQALLHQWLFDVVWPHLLFAFSKYFVLHPLVVEKTDHVSERGGEGHSTPSVAEKHFVFTLALEGLPGLFGFYWVVPIHKIPTCFCSTRHCLLRYGIPPASHAQVDTSVTRCIWPRHGLKWR